MSSHDVDRDVSASHLIKHDVLLWLAAFKQLLKSSQSQQNILLYNVTRKKSTSSPEEHLALCRDPHPSDNFVRQTIVLYSAR